MEVIKAIQETKLTLTGAPAILLMLHYVTIGILVVYSALRWVYELCSK